MKIRFKYLGLTQFVEADEVEIRDLPGMVAVHARTKDHLTSLYFRSEHLRSIEAV
jgi:hypothetical protein